MVLDLNYSHKEAWCLLDFSYSTNENNPNYWSMMRNVLSSLQKNNIDNPDYKENDGENGDENDGKKYLEYCKNNVTFKAWGRDCQEINVNTIIDIITGKDKCEFRNRCDATGTRLLPVLEKLPLEFEKLVITTDGELHDLAECILFLTECQIKCQEFCQLKAR